MYKCVQKITGTLLFFSLLHLGAHALSSIDINGIEFLQVQGTNSQKKIEMYGKIRSAKQSKLHFPIQGKIETIHIIDGQTVEKGESLVTLDSRDNHRTIQDAQQQVLESEKELLTLAQEQKKLEIQMLKDKHAFYLAKKNHEKQKSLFSNGIISKVQLEEAAFRMDEKKAILLQTEYKSSLVDDKIALVKARIELANTTENVTKQWVERSTLKAPFKGKVQKISVQPGQQVTQHDSVMELIDAEHMLIRAVLSHSEVVQLKQDLESSSHLPVKVAIGQQVVDAKITSILPDSKNNLIGVDIVLLTDQVIDGINEDISFTMLVPTNKKVFELPSRALINQRYVYKLNDNHQIESVPVEVVQFAKMKNEKILIETDRLNQVDTILVAKNGQLQPGEKIDIS